MNKKSPLLDKATALLLKYLDDGAVARLPTVARLSREARVSVYTMSMAARKLADEGRLAVLEGRGIWRAGTEPSASVDDKNPHDPGSDGPSVGKHERVCARLERDILTGLFDLTMPLPLLKELCSRYDIAPRGMKRVLDALAFRGVLGARKRSYHVKHDFHKPGHSALVMMVDAAGSALVTARIQFNSRLINELEKQCRRQNIEFVLCPVGREDEGVSGGLEKSLCKVERSYAVVGYIVTGYYLANPKETIRRICGRGKPVAVVYEGRTRQEDIDSFPGNAHAFLFDSGRPSGARVARHLLHLGHRSIAYVDYEGADGSRPDRFAEIERVVTNAGGRVAVSTISAVMDEKINTCFEDAAAEIARQMKAEKLHSAVDRTLKERVREKVMRGSVGENYRVNLHAALDRLFETERFTAIVTGGDTTPMFILEYLQLRKIAVPGQVSLVGFGNSLAESEKGITSHDYDCYSTAHAIIWHLLRPQQRNYQAQGRLTVIDGVLMPRMSTGPVNVPPASASFSR